jgi:hypothetical protein
MILDLFFLHLLQVTKHQERKREVSGRDFLFICSMLIYNDFAALAYEKLYLEHLPTADMYEKSYMHRDVLNQVAVTK